ncbi:phage tail protein [Streptomyces carminius]|uniref:Phage tail protein n=1 Tax=Streptomyces carminius TaxID=2665496 RepID=A0A2M8MC24_9ACTN|nr:phage tail protein [Streptomyces carminius]PJE97969.1 phage tail protein [Streptomyces carminius]PJF01795.1 phage tail protein [Streptomyces carminius]
MAQETGDTLATHTFKVQLGGVQVETVQEISGLSMELDSIDVVQITQQGQLLVRKLPGARKGGEVTITRGMDQASSFTEWIKKTFQQGDISAAREQLSIIFTDAKGGQDRTINLKNAWANRWEGPSLKAGDAQPATERVTVVFEDIEFN